MIRGRPSVTIASESAIFPLATRTQPHSAHMNAAAAMDAVTIGYEYHPKKIQPESALRPHKVKANDNAIAPTNAGGHSDPDCRTSKINAIAPSKRNTPTVGP